MESTKKYAIAITVILLLAVGLRIGLIYHANHEEMATPANPYEPVHVSDDDAVFLRKLRPDSLKDERALIGKTLWISAGGQMDYYHYANHHADYSKQVGTLPGATPLIITDVFEQVPPHSGRPVARIPAGLRHVLLAFTMPNSPDPRAQFAVPVGNYDATGYNFFTDEIFFYDDPHTLYKHWGADMWSHVDKHEAVPGMSENQAMMALGQVINPHGDKTGDRSITFDNDGHPIDITFVDNKATRITPQ